MRILPPARNCVKSLSMLLALPASPRVDAFHALQFSTAAASISWTTSTCSSPSSSSTSAGEEVIMFGPYKISPQQVFYRSKLTMGIVNLKPIVPGHVLIVPYRVVDRFPMLSPEEVSDLYASVYEIGPALEKHYLGEALTISMQDGKAAGQTVPHVHVHLLPRKPGDFKHNDEIYEELDQQHLDRHFDLDEDRRPRSLEEMAQEAMELRTLFPDRQLSKMSDGVVIDL